MYLSLTKRSNTLLQQAIIFFSCNRNKNITISSSYVPKTYALQLHDFKCFANRPRIRSSFIFRIVDVFSGCIHVYSIRNKIKLIHNIANIQYKCLPMKKQNHNTFSQTFSIFSSFVHTYFCTKINLLLQLGRPRRVSTVSHNPPRNWLSFKLFKVFRMKNIRRNCENLNENL